MDREQKRKHDEPRRPRDLQRHARRSHASTNHHRGDQASFAGERSVTRPPSDDDAAGVPPTTSRYHDRTPHRTGTHRQHHHDHHHYASDALHGTAATRRNDDQVSYAQDLSGGAPPYAQDSRGGIRTHRNVNDLPAVEEASFAGQHSVTRASYGSTTHHHFAEAVSSVMRDDAGAMPRRYPGDGAMPPMIHGTGANDGGGTNGKNNQRNDHSSGNQAVMGSSASLLSSAPGAGCRRSHRNPVDAGDSQPGIGRLCAGLDETVAVKGKDHASCPGVANGRNQLSFATVASTPESPSSVATAVPSALASGENIEDDKKGTELFAPNVEQPAASEEMARPVQEVTVFSAQSPTSLPAPGAFAVAGPGGPNPTLPTSPEQHRENVSDTEQPEAELVDIQNAELVHVVYDLPDEGNPAQSRKCQVFLAAFSLAAIVAVVLGITLSQHNNGPNATPPPTPEATPPPTPEPAISQQELKEFIASVSFDGGAALEDSKSPQYQALMWLYNDTLREDYPDWQKIQRYALATLRYSTNETEWDTDTHWLSEFNECAWLRHCSSTCNDGNSIICLDLHNNGLTGSIPPELALLSNSLVYLDLSSNNIGGSIPSELGLLSNLETMLLGSNVFTGRIPTEVGLLTKMTNLNLRNNALTGVIPTVFNSMTNLDYLNLYNNNFTGEFECPDFIEYCYI